MRYQGSYDRALIEKVLALFYRTELKENEIRIDNRTTTIAKELSISVGLCDYLISSHLNQKYKNWGNKNN